MNMVTTTIILIEVIGSLPVPGTATQDVQHSPPFAPPLTKAPAADRAVGQAEGEAQDGAEEEEDMEGEEIVVSGMRPRGSVISAISAESAFNARTIRALGASSFDEVLEAFAPQSRSAGGDDEPIVLLNGRRIGSMSEVGTLPPEAIRRIEIFPEQVAIQYGYTARQRVVNVILRKNYRSAELQGQYNLASAGGRTAFRAKGNLLRLTPDGRWNLDTSYRRQLPVYEASGAGPGDRRSRTQAPRTDRFTINNTISQDFQPFNLTGNANAELEHEASRLGRDLDQKLIRRFVDRRSVHGGMTFNGRQASWIWSAAANYDNGYEKTRTSGQFGADINAPLLGARSRRVERAVDLAASGTILSLPAGKTTGSVGLAFASRDQRTSRLSAAEPAMTQSQDAGHVNASVDIPLISGKGGKGPPGNLSLLLNGQVEKVSHYGDLATYGYGFRWEPLPGATFTLSARHAETAAEFSALADAAILTPNLRVYDFRSGATAAVARLDGGNSALTAEKSRLLALHMQLRPFMDENVGLSADYSDMRKRNMVSAPLGPTPQVEAALPDRFIRDADGTLLNFDRRPVNLFRTKQRQLRWGVNYSKASGVPKSLDKVLQSQTSPSTEEPTSASEAGSASNGRPSLSRPASSPDQIQFAFYHTWHLEDRAVLRDGLPSVDLLDGAAVDNRGGQPRHELEVQAGYASKMFGIRFAANWESRTIVRDMTLAAASPHALTFSRGVKLDLRLFLNLRMLGQPLNLPWLKGRLNLSIDNVLDSRTRIRDENGQRVIYDRGASEVAGRSLRLTFRKIFH